MKNVYKYTLDKLATKLMLPCSAVVVHVGEQQGDVQIWVEVDLSHAEQERTFVIFGTGHNISDGDHSYLHMGSVQMSNGLVWHIYEELSL